MLYHSMAFRRNMKEWIDGEGNNERYANIIRKLMDQSVFARRYRYARCCATCDDDDAMMCCGVWQHYIQHPLKDRQSIEYDDIAMNGSHKKTLTVDSNDGSWWGISMDSWRKRTAHPRPECHQRETPNPLRRICPYSDPTRCGSCWKATDVQCSFRQRPRVVSFSFSLYRKNDTVKNDALIVQCIPPTALP